MEGIFILKPVIIPLKDRDVELNQNVIEFTFEQIIRIKRNSALKNYSQWISLETDALRIKMEPEQIEQVLSFRDTIIDVFASTKTVEELRESNVIGFSKHSLKRVRERLISEETKRLGHVTELKKALGMDSDIDEFEKHVRSSDFQDEILSLLINSVNVDNFFHWKAYPNVSFKFKGVFREIYDIGISIALSVEDSVIVTITLENVRTNVAESIRVAKKR